jgi:hypothetical protein
MLYLIVEMSNLRFFMQGQCTSRGQEIEHGVFYGSQLGDGIGTQESIQANKGYTSQVNQVQYKIHCSVYFYLIIHIIDDFILLF